MKKNVTCILKELCGRGAVQRKGKALLLSILGVALLLPVQARAAQPYTCTASIPAEVREEGSENPEGTEYTVKIRGLEDAPLPEQSEVSVTDEGQVSFGPIAYTKPGIYRYEIWQEAEKLEHFTLDDSVYTVTVKVTNAEDPSAEYGLEATIWAIRNGQEEKSEIVFVNGYEKPSKPWTPGQDDDGEEEDPPVVTAVTPQPPAPVEIPPVPQESTPQTGDQANAALWAALGICALALIAAILRGRRREEAGEC